MKVSTIIAGLLPLASLIVAAPGCNDVEKVASKKIDQLQKNYQKYIEATIKKRQTGCTSKNILRRKEWGKLSKKERTDYIEAIYCLNRKPGLTPRSEIPGARSRWDDFVGSHIQLTPVVHANGFFLAYHRFLIWEFERALREECGYKGTQPYWDWTLEYEDQTKSTVWDGSPSSLGSNGVYVANRSAISVRLPTETLVFPPATGGGCVQSGPFTADKFTINLGPIGYEPKGPEGGLGFNPRCLTRDFNPELSRTSLRPSNITALLDCPTYACFNRDLDKPNRKPGFGVHGAGHFQFGTVQLDTFISPSDPAFWVHHTQLDRIWTIWQNQDPAVRTYALWGTQTTGNFPPSANVTSDTPVPFGHISPPIPLKNLQSSIDGPHCYIYE